MRKLLVLTTLIFSAILGCCSNSEIKSYKSKHIGYIDGHAMYEVEIEGRHFYWTGYGSIGPEIKVEK